MVPWDLWIAVLVIATVAIFAFRIGLLAKRAHTNPLVPLAAALLVSVLLCLVFRANLRWAGAIPLAAVVIWSNLVPVVLAFTAGVTWNTSVLGSKFRSATSGFLVLLSLAYLVMPVARPCLAPPELQPPVWGDDVVCLQSHDSTCAPAAAVTLLNLNGIRSSEKEMVRLCLTSQQGTEALGLFRGLKLGSQKNGHKVQIASRNPVDWISSGQLPNVALVCFPGRRVWADTRHYGTSSVPWPTARSGARGGCGWLRRWKMDDRRSSRGIRQMVPPGTVDPIYRRLALSQRALNRQPSCKRS